MNETAEEKRVESVQPQVDPVGPEKATASSKIPLSANLRTTDAPEVHTPGTNVNLSEESVTWKCGDPFRHPIPETNEDAWGVLYKHAKNYDKNMCSDWKDEIEKHLVFAGLFSAAVTTFVVDSYKNLDTDQEATMVQLLTRISSQLDHIVTNGSNQIPSLPVAQSPPPTAIRVNIAWFLSLTLSLTTVLIGIICLQWLREYERYGNQPHKDALMLRQMRYDGLKMWYLPAIISSIPVLLQIALVLFFVGIIDQLWTLEHVVAIPIIVASGFLFLFMLTTTVLPVLQCFYAQFSQSRFNAPQCPYKSPQSFAAHWLGKLPISPLLWAASIYLVYTRRNGNNDIEAQATNLDVAKLFPNLSAIKEVISVDSWSEYDTHWRLQRESVESEKGVITHSRAGDDVAALSWLRRTFATSHESIMALCHCFSSLTLTRQREILRELKINIQWTQNDEIKANDNLARDIHCFYYFVRVSKTNKSVRMSLEKHYLELYIRIRGSLKNSNLIGVGFNPFVVNYTREHVSQLFQVIESFIKTKNNYGFDAGRFILQVLKFQEENPFSTESGVITQRLGNFNQLFIDRLLKSKNAKCIIESIRYIFKLRLLDWPSMFEKYPNFMVQYITILCCTEHLARMIDPNIEFTRTILDTWQVALGRMKAAVEGQQPFTSYAQDLVNKGITNAKDAVGFVEPPSSGISGDERWKRFVSS